MEEVGVEEGDSIVIFEGLGLFEEGVRGDVAVEEGGFFDGGPALALAEEGGGALVEEHEIDGLFFGAVVEEAKASSHSSRVCITRRLSLASKMARTGTRKPAMTLLAISPLPDFRRSS